MNTYIVSIIFFVLRTSFELLSRFRLEDYQSVVWNFLGVYYLQMFFLSGLQIPRWYLSLITKLKQSPSDCFWLVHSCEISCIGCICKLGWLVFWDSNDPYSSYLVVIDICSMVIHSNIIHSIFQQGLCAFKSSFSSLDCRESSFVGK